MCACKSLAAHAALNLPAGSNITAPKVCICNVQVSTRACRFRRLRLEVQSYEVVVVNEQTLLVRQTHTNAINSSGERMSKRDHLF